MNFQTLVICFVINSLWVLQKKRYSVAFKRLHELPKALMVFWYNLYDKINIFLNTVFNTFLAMSPLMVDSNYPILISKHIISNLLFNDFFGCKCIFGARLHPSLCSLANGRIFHQGKVKSVPFLFTYAYKHIISGYKQYGFFFCAHKKSLSDEIYRFLIRSVPGEKRIILFLSDPHPISF